MFETAKVDYNTLGSALGLGGLNPYQQGQQQALAQQQQQEAIQQQELQRQRALQMQQDLANFSTKPNQDPKELISLMLKYPEYEKQLSEPYKLLKSDVKQKTIQEAVELNSVVSSGTPEQIKQYLDSKYQSALNSGDEETIASAESVKDLYDHHPEALKSSVLQNLGALVGFDKLGNYLKNTMTPEEKAREARLTQEAKNQANPYFDAQQQADLRGKIATANKALRTPEEIANQAGLIAKAQAPYRSKGFEITTNPDGTTTITQGGNSVNGGLEKPVKTELQKSIINLEKSASDLRNIVASAKPEFNTYQYQASNALNKFADKFGKPIDKNKIGEYKRYQNNVKQFFNAYKKEITGSVAAVQEIQDLQDSLFSVDSSPTEFQAGLKQVQETVNRHLRLQRKLLREGVSGNKIGKALDDAILSGQDDDPKARALDLKGKYPPSRVRVILKQEGYAI